MEAFFINYTFIINAIWNMDPGILSYDPNFTLIP
jgi:hypothetical protein